MEELLVNCHRKFAACIAAFTFCQIECGSKLSVLQSANLKHIVFEYTLWCARSTSGQGGCFLLWGTMSCPVNDCALFGATNSNLFLEMLVLNHKGVVRKIVELRP